MRILCVLAAAGTMILAGCAGIPKGVEAVEDVDLERYQGTWYEIARLDHRFERGLSRVSATYTPREDGGLNVVNRGYDKEKGRWRQVEGRAYPSGEPGEGRLKVTFFWPFYGAYNIIALEREGYAYAMVCGSNTSYLWILAREPHLPQDVLDRLVAKARRLGFPTDELIFVEHPEET